MNGRGKRLREIVRRKADATFRRGQAEPFHHRPAHPRTRRRVGRPGPIVQAAENENVRVLQAGFQQAPDVHARVQAVARVHRAAGDQGIEQAGIGRAFDGVDGVGRLDQLGGEIGRRLARLARPQPQGAGPVAFAGGKRLGRRDVRAGEVLEGDLGPAREIGEIERANKRRRRPRPRGRRPPPPDAILPVRRGPGPRNAASSSARTRARKSPGARPPDAKGCFSKASSGRGANSSAAAREQAQEHAGRRLIERPAGRIVHRDSEAAQFRRDPARQRAVGRHQRRRAALVAVLQRLAQDQRDHARLLVRGRAIDPRHPVQRAVMNRFRRRPRCRRTQRRRRQPGAVRQRRCDAG